VTARLALPHVRTALAAHRPVELPADRRAAVACVLAGPADALEMLFIERAEWPGDPWSGQMAFPGGRVDPGDVDAEAAAQRETLEEVGLDLTAAERLGRLDDRIAGPGRVGDLVLSSFVYHLPARPALAHNHEVRMTLWVPVTALVAPARRVDHPWPRSAPLSSFPGILVGEPGRHVVWGLTYRVVEDLLTVCGAAVG